MPKEFCHCGKPLHYTDPVTEKATRELISTLGEFVRVIAGGRAWLVPRHYIALHGIKSVDLPFLGFQEITGQDGKENASGMPSL